MGVFGRFQQQALGEFQLQQVRGQAFFLEDQTDRGHQVGVGELLGRKVDGHVQAAHAGLLQLLAHAARLAHHPLANRDDQAGFLGNADELVRTDHAALGMVPA